MKKHPVLIPIIGKICSKCNIDKPKDSFHNDKYEDGKKTICKECVKVSNQRLNETKANLDCKHDVKCVLDINII
jgi:hypothetical protein